MISTKYTLEIILIIALVISGCADGRLLGGAVNVTGLGIGTTDRGRAPNADPLEKATFKPRVEKQKLSSLNIVRKSDGFITNGKRYIDPFGKTIDISKLSDTGYVTYTIRNPKDLDNESFVVKTKNTLSDSKAVEVGLLKLKNDHNVYFTTKDGDTFNGDQYILYSKGLVLTRDRTVVIYFPFGSKPRIHALPQEYVFTSYQKGDVSFSKHVTIQRRIGKAIGLLGTALRNVEEFDVSLFNVETGKITTTFSMQLRGANESEQIQHFKNTFYLFNSKSGPITISLEDVYKKVVARNLISRKKSIVFERERGISFVKAGVSKGKIWTQASLGFSDKQVNDVESLLKGLVITY